MDKEREQSLRAFHDLGYRTTYDLQILSAIMDGGASEDLLLLAHAIVSQKKPRNRLKAIENTVYRWMENGWDTPEAVRAGLAAAGELPDDWEAKMKAMLGIRNRELAPTEKKYLARWKEFGLPEDVMRLAYERTVVNTGSMSYPYMNAVLNRWYELGLMTVEAVTEADAGSRIRRRDEIERLDRENRILRLKVNELQEALIHEKQKVVQLLEERESLRQQLAAKSPE